MCKGDRSVAPTIQRIILRNQGNCEGTRLKTQAPDAPARLFDTLAWPDYNVPIPSRGLILAIGPPSGHQRSAIRSQLFIVGAVGRPAGRPTGVLKADSPSLW